MASIIYNETNKNETIESLITKSIKNTRILIKMLMEISEDLEEKFPELIREDEEKCLAREAAKIQKLMENSYFEPSDEEKEKTKSLRLLEACAMLPECYRLSHVLDEGGYDWDDFFENEEDEPIKEKIMRQSVSVEKRHELRHTGMEMFIGYTHYYWDEIQKKNKDFLVNHFSVLLPNSELSDKIGVIFQNKNGKEYLTEKQFDRIWRIIHGCIELSIKYMYHSGNNKFLIKNIDSTEREFTIDVDDQIKKWGVLIELA